MNANTFKTTLLLASLTGLFVFLGSLIGGTGGMIFAFMIAVAMNMGAWWFSDRLALSMSGAKPADENDFAALHAMVERLSENSGLPKPKVYVIDSPMPNAFATGRSPQHGAVAVTTGIMGVLTEDELAGVVAHELAHIKHRDTLISSVAATVGGAITMIADMAMWSMLFGGFGGGDEEDEGGSMAGGLVMMILAPIAAVIIQMAISRGREFLADEGGARILGDPLPLARALEKIEAWAKQAQPMPVNPATSHLYIISPLHGGLAGLFRTHPDTQERVRRLHEMARQPSHTLA
jgi:heat shock protein HtpX